MSKTSIYLNFDAQTEEAFNFYKEVFESELSSPFLRYKDVPQDDEMNNIAEDEKELIMHVALPILGGVEIMGTDVPKSMGYKLEIGNNVTINLEFDNPKEAKEMYKKLSKDATEKEDVVKTFWGYWGTCLDKFGIRWMFNVDLEK